MSSSSIYNALPVVFSLAATTLSGLQVSQFARTSPQQTALLAGIGFITSLFLQAVTGAFRAAPSRASDKDPLSTLSDAKDKDPHSTLSLVITNLTAFAGIGFSIQAQYDYIGVILKNISKLHSKYINTDSSFYTKIAQNKNLISFNLGFNAGTALSRSFTFYTHR